MAPTGASGGRLESSSRGVGTREDGASIPHVAARNRSSSSAGAATVTGAGWPTARFLVGVAWGTTVTTATTPLLARLWSPPILLRTVACLAVLPSHCLLVFPSLDCTPARAQEWGRGAQPDLLLRCDAARDNQKAAMREAACSILERAHGTSRRLRRQKRDTSARL